MRYNYSITTTAFLKMITLYFDVSISSNDLPTKLENIPIIFKSNRYMHPKLYKDVIMTAARHSLHPGHRKYVILFSIASKSN